MSTPENPVTWNVVSQRETSELVDNAVINGVRVSWKTNSGLSGSVFIPSTQYRNADAVRSAIAAAVAASVSIQNLSGTHNPTE